MRHIHSQEKEQFKKLFKQEHIDNIEDRFKVLEVFLQIERHITVGELIELLHKNGYRFDPDFVKDTLRFITRFGFAQKRRFNDGQIRYEHRHLGQHHDHMICVKCNKIIEFSNEQIENLQAMTASNYGFYMLQHKMEIYGICSECKSSRIQYLPLVKAKEGELLEIREFAGGLKSQMRLMSMGLRPGDKIEVITNSSKGQLVVAADFKRYVLGRGLANKILVQEVKQVDKSKSER